MGTYYMLRSNYNYKLVGQGLEGKVFQGNCSALAKFRSD